MHKYAFDNHNKTMPSAYGVYHPEADRWLYEDGLFYEEIQVFEFADELEESINQALKHMTIKHIDDLLIIGCWLKVVEETGDWFRLSVEPDFKNHTLSMEEYLNEISTYSRYINSHV